VACPASGPLTAPVLDLRRLRVLREVARQGTLAGAARALRYTPSAVSQHVAQLERELGCGLVERSANRVVLTEAGRLLVEHAERIMEQVEIAAAQVQATAGLRVGRLRVGTFGTAGPTLLAPAVEAYTRHFPGAEIVVYEADPEDSLPRLRARELDLVVTYEYDLCPVPVDPGLRRHLVARDAIRLVVPRAHPLAGRTEVALSALAGERWIVEPRPDCHHFTVKLCAQAGFRAPVSCESSDYYIAQALVAAGLGLALIPEMALSTMHPEVVALRLSGPPAVRRLFATHRDGEEDMESIRTMLAILRERGAMLGEPA
jgi:DNA-binding transcriptional LysR family regulator